MGGLVAALSWGAAAVHLAMVPQHASDSMAMGLAFAAAGWCQIAVGVAVLARPRRAVLLAAVASNLVFAAAWAWSRTIGLPAWTGEEGTQEVALVDGFCVALEL